MSRISPLAHAFVGLVFTLLGASFFASTGLLIYEFRHSHWDLLLFSHSHLFFFFPVFGIMVLAAFYIPSVVFTDFYWRRGNVPLGRTRFMFGTLVVLVVAAGLTLHLANQQPRGIWEISPMALAADQAAPPVVVDDCRTESGGPCVRQPLLMALRDLRERGLQRQTITEFARSCSSDPMMEAPETDKAMRWCFPAGARMSAKDCCTVQRQFAGDVAAKFHDEKARSLISRVEEVATFFKVFFVIVLVVIGILLVVWQDQIARKYENRLPAIERGVIVGAIGMLFWLLMDYGFQQTSDVLVGRAKPGFPFRLSLIVAPWTAVLILYFVKRMGNTMFNAAQLSTILGSAVAVLRYEQISNASVRMLGSGAETGIFVALIVLAVFGIGLVYGPWMLPLPPARRYPRQPSHAPPLT